MSSFIKVGQPPLSEPRRYDRDLGRERRTLGGYRGSNLPLDQGPIGFVRQVEIVIIQRSRPPGPRLTATAFPANSQRSRQARQSPSQSLPPRRPLGPITRR